MRDRLGGADNPDEPNKGDRPNQPDRPDEGDQPREGEQPGETGQPRKWYEFALDDESADEQDNQIAYQEKEKLRAEGFDEELLTELYGTDAELGFAGASDEPETSEQADEPDEVASGWDVPAVSDDPDRPNFDDIHLPEGRQEHLLDGDATGGGHRHGTGRPKKTEFPEYWSDETIIDNVADVARNPDKAPFHQDNGRWRARGTRDEVEITAILEPDGRIWTAWPHEGGPGVVRNPKEGQQ